MNLAHLHLLLNHIPTIGTAIGLALFTVALLKNSDELKRASLVIFVGIALAAIPTFTSGSAAQLKLCEAPRGMPCGDYPAGVSKSWIEAHENAALVAFSVLELAGGFAWLALWQYRRRSRASGGALAAVLVLALLSFGLMARAANIGGEIRHPEIRAGGAPAEAETLTRQLGAALSGGTQWAWPASETLHFIGLTLLFGVVLLVDLRMLGMMKSVPFQALHRLLPWGMLGLGLNVVTGMLFVIASPWQYAEEPVFLWKLLLLVLAGANALYFTLFDQAWVIGPGDDAPFLSKAVAASAIALWVGVIFCGHMLPFIGGAF